LVSSRFGTPSLSFSTNGLHQLLLDRFRVEKTTTLSWNRTYGALQLAELDRRERGLLYRILKRETPLVITLGQFVLGGVLVVPALFSLIEAAIGRGGVLRMVARSGHK
jgi:hypothetical protein